jgi:hypothetical protein
LKAIVIYRGFGFFRQMHTFTHLGEQVSSLNSIELGPTLQQNPNLLVSPLR